MPFQGLGVLFRGPQRAFRGTPPRKVEHFLEIVAEADEALFGFDFFLPSHGEPAEAECLLDNPEDGFNRLLAQLTRALCLLVFGGDGRIGDEMPDDQKRPES